MSLASAVELLEQLQDEAMSSQGRCAKGLSRRLALTAACRQQLEALASGQATTSSIAQCDSTALRITSEVNVLGQSQRSESEVQGSCGEAGEDQQLAGLLWAGLLEAEYLLALDLLVCGGPEERGQADPLIRRLGYRLRLSNAVWDTCRPQAPSHQEPHLHLKRSSGLPLAPVASALSRDVQQGHQLSVPHQPRPATSSSPPLRFPSTENQACHAWVPYGLNSKTCGPPSNIPQTPQPVTTTPPPLVFDPAPLPPATLAALQRAFRPESPFWSDHAYSDPATPFFSYLSDLSRPPSNIVDLACHQQKASLATLMSDYPTGGSTQECSFAWLAQQVQRATHVEWWAHTRVPPLTSHQLHWDCDERRLRRGAQQYALRHPLVSSVMYLSCSDPGAQGPTLILDQVPGQQVKAPTTGDAQSEGKEEEQHEGETSSRAWAVHARQEGRYLVFPGDLLHGVLPAAPPTPPPTAPAPALSPPAAPQVQERNAATPAQDQAVSEMHVRAPGDEGARGSPQAPPPPRTTLMLAWWDNSSENLEDMQGQEKEQQEQEQELGQQCWGKDDSSRRQGCEATHGIQHAPEHRHHHNPDHTRVIGMLQPQMQAPDVLAWWDNSRQGTPPPAEDLEGMQGQEQEQEQEQQMQMQEQHQEQGQGQQCWGNEHSSSHQGCKGRDGVQGQEQQQQEQQQQPIIGKLGPLMQMPDVGLSPPGCHLPAWALLFHDLMLGCCTNAVGEGGSGHAAGETASAGTSPPPPPPPTSTQPPPSQAAQPHQDPAGAPPQAPLLSSTQAPPLVHTEPPSTSTRSSSLIRTQPHIWSPTPVTPAWQVVQGAECTKLPAAGAECMAAGTEVGPGAEGLPDLRFFIPGPEYFQHLYPVT